MKDWWPRASKAVGWETPCTLIPIPMRDEILATLGEAVSYKFDAWVQLIRWNRYCKSPETPDEVSAITWLPASLKVLRLLSEPEYVVMLDEELS